MMARLTTVSVYFGSALLLMAAQAHAQDVIVDNGSPDVSRTGTWTTSSYSGEKYGADYFYAASGTANRYVTYAPQLQAGLYDVYLWWNDGSDRASKVPISIYANGLRYYVEKDMRTSGGQWVQIGTYTFGATKGAGNAVLIKTQLDDGTNANGYVIADAVRFVPKNATNYAVRLDVPRQVIAGLGVEIQSDSIGSGNNGLPTDETSVPHDLVASERTRLATDLIGRGNGFRYIRLAGGLYYRGLRNGGQNLDGRWPEQLGELSTLISQSGVEGVDLEYWSPTPYWKSTGSYIGGTLKGFDPTTLGLFGDAVVEDIRYLKANGVPVVQFGLQNEPVVTQTNYSQATYTDAQYVAAYNAVNAKVRAAYPAILLHANSWDGQNRATLRTGLDLSLVDAWTWHKIGADSNLQIDSQPTFVTNTLGKPVFNDEFEYLDNVTSEARMLNTGQSIMNWFTFENAPTWYWLHALKPTYNSEAQGYALGYWRPSDDNDFTKFAGIAKGYFDFEPRNWRSVEGFLDWMPWNSQRYQVDEPLVLKDQRILAFRQGGPTGKLVIVLSNRGTSDFTFNIDANLTSYFTGYRYSLTAEKQALTTIQGNNLQITVPPNAFEFWVEQ
ncbi:MAG: golvesin C-terminal-like domain-containing protein [Sphingomonas sp.]|uniref:golvesin C-terminal-like domain-containing protein n=1 Tax=Sphingomonas sp. TaxID=28214 RepID=UPI003F81CD3A